MKNLNYTILLFLLFTSQTLFAQSPWTQKKGSGYYQASVNLIGNYSTLHFNGSDSWNLSREVSDMTAAVYGEYGLTDKITVIAELPYKFLSTGSTLLPNPSVVNPTNQEGSLNTLGNIKLGLRNQFINKSVVFSGQLTLELPTSTYDDKTGLSAGYDAVSIIPSISVGKGYDKYYGYLSIGTGIKSNNYSEDLRVSGEFGAKVLDRLWIIGVLDVLKSFENGDYVAESRNLETGLYVDQQEYTALGLKFILEATDKLGFNAGFYGGPGNFVASQVSMNFGVYLKVE